MKNRKILVFGSSGFLGNHLVKSLYKDNKVIQFDTNPPQREYKGTSFIQGSILDKTLVINAMEDIEIVYHFAAMTDIDIVNDNPAQAIEVNIAGTSNVLEACAQTNVKHLLYLKDEQIKVFIENLVLEKIGMSSLTLHIEKQWRAQILIIKKAECQKKSIKIYIPEYDVICIPHTPPYNKCSGKNKN